MEPAGSVRIDRVHRAGLALPLAALLLAGCAAPARLGWTDRQRLVGRTYVIVGASSGFGRGAADGPAGRGRRRDRPVGWTGAGRAHGRGNA